MRAAGRRSQSERVLVPAAYVLGGLTKVHEITNPSYMRRPVSPLFHGRDVFSPAAAHLANGIPIEAFGPALDPASLVPAPYDEATVADGVILARVIQVNRFGSLHLNIRHEQWDALHVGADDGVALRMPDGRSVLLRVGRTFGDVPEGECVIMKDDYGRVEVARNLGSFVQEYPATVGDEVEVHLTPG